MREYVNKKIIQTLISIIIFNNIIPCFAEIISTSRPLNSYYKGLNKPYNTNHDNIYITLNHIENIVYNKNFSNENIISRLERLEESVIGAIQVGDIYTRCNNIENLISSRYQNNYKSGFLKTLGQFIFGQMTGYTPPISNHSHFSNNPYNYENIQFEETNNPFGSSYSLRNFSTGNSSSIRILD